MKLKKRWFARRKFLIGSISLFSGVFLSNFKMLANATENKQNDVSQNARIGVNLNGLSDWGTEQPFVDFFLCSRDWISQSTLKDSKWGSGVQLTLDKYGWVEFLPENTIATRMISSVEAGHYPSGKYTVIYDGDGELRPNYVGQIIERTAGRMVVDVDASKGLFMIDLLKTNPENYIKNIRVIAPGFEAEYKKNPWNPLFLKRWSGIACLRFMDFMATNDSKQVQWVDRPKIEDASYSAKGVPLELLVDLANRLKTDAWFCMPHQANDEYVRSFATYVKQELNNSLNSWVEYSNEVWNGQFEQAKYAVANGKRLGLSAHNWEAGHKFTAYRSIQIFKIWKSIYGEDAENLIRVVSGMAAVHGVAENILNFKRGEKIADALAIAPYFGMGVQTKSKSGLTDKVVANWSLDMFFKHVEKVLLPISNKSVDEHKKIADEHGMKLVAYESGQHFVGVGAALDNERLTKLFIKANKDKRMGVFYRKNLDYWKDAGGDLNCTYSSVNAWSKWGSWGLLQNNSEDPKKSPKFTAVIDWAVKQGQKMHY